MIKTNQVQALRFKIFKVVEDVHLEEDGQENVGAPRQAVPPPALRVQAVAYGFWG